VRSSSWVVWLFIVPLFIVPLFAVPLFNLNCTWQDFYFICDIFLNFRTAFYDDAGILVISTREIASSYARGWMVRQTTDKLLTNY